MFATRNLFTNWQDLNLVGKYFFSHVCHHIFFFFSFGLKNDKLATHMHTYKARLNPPLSSSSKYNNWKEKCQHTYLLQLHNISSTGSFPGRLVLLLKKSMYPCCGSFFSTTLSDSTNSSTPFLFPFPYCIALKFWEISNISNWK